MDLVFWYSSSSLRPIISQAEKDQLLQDDISAWLGYDLEIRFGRDTGALGLWKSTDSNGQPLPLPNVDVKAFLVGQGGCVPHCFFWTKRAEVPKPSVIKSK
jgi:hypothetical protein